MPSGEYLQEVHKRRQMKEPVAEIPPVDFKLSDVEAFADNVAHDVGAALEMYDVIYDQTHPFGHYIHCVSETVMPPEKVEDNAIKIRRSALVQAPKLVLACFLGSDNKEDYADQAVATFWSATLPGELQIRSPEIRQDKLHTLSFLARLEHDEAEPLITVVERYYKKVAFGDRTAELAASSMGFALNALNEAWQAMREPYIDATVKEELRKLEDELGQL